MHYYYCVSCLCSTFAKYSCTLNVRRPSGMWYAYIKSIYSLVMSVTNSGVI